MLIGGVVGAKVLFVHAGLIDVGVASCAGAVWILLTDVPSEPVDVERAHDPGVVLMPVDQSSDEGVQLASHFLADQENIEALVTVHREILDVLWCALGAVFGRKNIISLVEDDH